MSLVERRKIFNMKLTTKQLKQMIKEEISKLTESTGMPQLDSLLQSDDPGMIFQGIELADILGINLTFADLNQKTQVISAIVHSDIGQEDPEILRLLSTSLSPWVQGMVLKNPNTPLDIITDPKWYIGPADRAKWSLTRNPMLPLEQVKMLANSEHPRVRRRIVHHPNITIDILNKLSQDPVEYVRKEALEKLK